MSFISENVYGMPSVQASSSDKFNFLQLSRLQSEHVKWQSQLNVFNASLYALKTSMNLLSTLGIFTLGAYEYSLGNLTLGWLVAVQMLFYILIQHANNIVQFVYKIMDGIPDFLRIKDVAKYEIESAMSTLQRASDIQKNAKLMSDVKKLAAEKAKEFTSIAAGKKF